MDAPTLQAKLVEALQRIEELKAELYRTDGAVIVYRQLLAEIEKSNGQ